MLSCVNTLSLEDEPIIRVLAVSIVDDGITLLVETPIPQTWTDNGYVWSWQYKARHSIHAGTEAEAKALASEKIKWINQWEYRKSTETFTD